MARRSKICRAGLAGFFTLYLIAGAVAVVGTQGLFGTEPDGLAAIWLIFIGMPWTLALGFLPGNTVPVFLAQVFVVVAPLLNLWLLDRSCRRTHRRR